MTKRWRNLIGAWSLVTGLIGLCPQLSLAAQAVTKVRLDAATVAKGYTLSLTDVSIGIPPDAIPANTKMWLREKKNFPALPAELQAVSPVYLYALKPAVTSLNGQALWLSYAFTSSPDLQYERHFYYYNGTQGVWQVLPSNLDVFTGHVQAAWPLPYSIVVVADDTTDPLAPTRNAGSADLAALDAAAAVAIDETTGEVLYQNHPAAIRSVASLTKMMTAYVLLQDGIDFNQDVTYHTSYNQIGGRLYLSEGEVVIMNDLINGLLVGSANNAAYALVAAAGYSVPDFVQKMNEQAMNLGLTQTTFADPSGLDPKNQSTALEYAKWLRVAWQNRELARLSSTPYYEFTTKNTGVYHDFTNTNWLMATTDLNITGSKTGYLDEAQYCLAMRVTDNDHAVITVLLGAPTSTGRFSDSEQLMRWALENYSW